MRRDRCRTGRGGGRETAPTLARQSSAWSAGPATSERPVDRSPSRSAMPLVPTADPARTTSAPRPRSIGRRAPKGQGRQRCPTGRSAPRHASADPVTYAQPADPSHRSAGSGSDAHGATTHSCGRRSPRSDRNRARRCRRCWRARDLLSRWLLERARSGPGTGVSPAASPGVAPSSSPVTMARAVRTVALRRRQQGRPGPLGCCAPSARMRLAWVRGRSLKSRCIRSASRGSSAVG